MGRRIGLISLSMAALLGFSATAASGVEPRAATKGCPGTEGTSGWFCFYEHLNYNDGKKGWQESYNKTYSTAQNFSSNGRLDQLSSVINNSGYRICVYNNSALLFQVDPYVDIAYNANWKSVSGSSSCPKS